jgi:hypothetical protein
MTGLTAPFAAVEAGMNADVLRMLANAVATPAVGDPILVIFDKTTIETFGGEITSDGPVALALTADVAAYVSNVTTLTIKGGAYLLRDKKPDGTGMTLLILEDA